MPTSDLTLALRRSRRRVRVIVLALAVAACGSKPTTSPHPQPSATATTQAAADKLIPCATGNAPLESRCTVEIDKRPDGPIVTVRNPDGGFHRLQVARGGNTFEAADGAQPVILTPIDDNTVEVRIDADRYRLPARFGRR